MTSEEAQLEQLVQRFKSYAPQTETVLLEKSYRFSCEAHKTQKRAGEEPSFIHNRKPGSHLWDRAVSGILKVGSG